jgi:hypothetical protein
MHFIETIVSHHPSSQHHWWMGRTMTVVIKTESPIVFQSFYLWKLPEKTMPENITCDDFMWLFWKAYFHFVPSLNLSIPK